MKCFIMYLDFPFNNHGKNKKSAVVFGAQATTAQLYHGRDTF